MITNKKYKSDNDVHQTIMFKVLTDMFRSPIQHHIAFKWWTLCYFVYQLPRFSVDLDFDFLWEDFDQTKNVVRKILLKYWRIKQETNTKLILKYDEWQRPLKIEFNMNIASNDEYELVDFYGRSIKAMRLDCIVANKMIAQTQRKNKIARRDLFDIHFFLKQWFAANQKLVYEKTWKQYDEYIRFLIEFIGDNFHQSNVLEWLWELLDEKQKRWVKHHLIEETLSLLQFELFKAT